jgi:hypothetical protein
MVLERGYSELNAGSEQVKTRGASDRHCPAGAGCRHFFIEEENTDGVYILAVEL